jgi:sugar phosphate isomerase/epimerase
MWGVDQPWADVLPRLPDLGFVGIEAPLPFLQDHPPDLAARHGLRCLPMIFTEGATVAEHVASFREQLDACRTYDPVLVTCHDGRDAWTDDEAARYFREVLAIEADRGIPVAHETHRGRILFTPWRTVRLLDRFEALRLCCDFSHWVCVCERLLDDQEDALAYCAERALHVHARVGYEEGPQVPDPRAPECRPHLDAHERWWSLIWQAQHAQDHPASTLTPEFGPPPYLHTLPHTAMPVADLDAICTWMARRQADRFAQSFS